MQKNTTNNTTNNATKTNTKASPRSRAAACAALIGAALLSACAITVTHTGDATSSSKLKQGPAGTAKFECVQSPSGQCHYALYTSRCQSQQGEGGKPATTCTHQVFEQFSLAAGSSREVAGLPAGYKQCMKPGAQPQVPGCD